MKERTKWNNISPQVSSPQICWRKSNHRDKSKPKRGDDTQKFFIKTFGCQMNSRDSEEMVELLAGRGYTATAHLSDADVILFNTCSVRQHAEERVWGQVGMLRVLKEKNPNLVLGVVGCMAQAYKEGIFERLPHVDLVCGPDNIWELPAMIEKIREERRRFVACELEGALPQNGAPRHSKGRLTAYVSIMRGCDNFCSYCIVPYVRGRERSRSPEDILDEVKGLIEDGCKEVTLLGQNVNSYGKNFGKNFDRTTEPHKTTEAQRMTFPELLRKIDSLPERFRIRFLTSHPKDMGGDLIAAMAECAHICEHLHLPIQSGSDAVLQAMDRGYTATDFMQSIGMLRTRIPLASLTTDLIVGFPGERERDFAETRKLLEDVQFDDAFIFKYSPRPGTKAAQLADDVPQEVKEERHQILLDLQEEISAKKNRSLIGQEFEVLVEGESKCGGGQLMGRTRTHKKVVFHGADALVGQFVDIKVKDAIKHTLIGERSEQ